MMFSMNNNNERQTQESQQLLLNSRIAMNSSQASRPPPRLEPKQHKVTAFEGYGSNEPIELYYKMGEIHDSGAFGAVFTAHLPQLNDIKVAIKQVLQDKRYRNRELPLMKSLKHRNIVTLMYFFFSTTNQNGIYLNLVLEFMPETVNYLIRKHCKSRTSVPSFTVKLCMYQIFRALAYIHSMGICHRDIKPNNLLFDSRTGILKVCDFGSAKHLITGERNVSYICARYYRAPELLFGATDYSNMIDIWSAGCVFSELLLSEPIFHGETGIDQLVVIISKLGTPKTDQIYELNSNYVKYSFPQIRVPPLQSLFSPRTPSEAIDLISKLFEYKPSARIRPLQACAHSFFNELREPSKKGTNRELPPLFDFSQHELNIAPELESILIPNHIKRCVGDGSNYKGITPEINLISNGFTQENNTNITF